MALAVSFLWSAAQADASSRQESDDASGLDGQAQVDFTIVIPEFVSLGSDPGFSGAQQGIASRFMHPLSSSQQGATIGAAWGDGATNLFVISNAGTLAVSPAASGADSHMASASGMAPAANATPVAYTVAMP